MKVKAVFKAYTDEEVRRYAKVNDLCNAIFELKDYFLKKLKYEDFSDAESEIYSKVQDDFSEILENNYIKIDDIYS